MNISQIFISDEYVEELPHALDTAVKSVIANVDHSQHTIYLREPLRHWIESEYGGEMVRAYDKLKPYAYKADLARYLLLYKKGGWYFDISVRLAMTLKVQADLDLLVFGENPYYSRATFSCNNGVIYAKAGSPVLEATINDVCTNIANEYYGKNALYPTGPVCFGKNVAKYAPDLENVVSGIFMSLTPDMPKQNVAFILPDGNILAWYKDTREGGNLECLGARGTNNYMKMYRNRDIYDTSITISNRLTCHGMLD